MDAGIIQSSEYCKQVLLAKGTKGLPFDELKPGYSFFVPFGIVKEQSLRAMVSTMSSKKGKSFRCIKHEEYKVFEITVSSEEKLTFKITESSPKAKAFSWSNLEGKRIYDFENLPEGMSFVLPIKNTNEKSLKAACCINSKKLNTKFVVITHDEHGIFEVYHVRKDQIRETQFFEPSVQAISWGQVSQDSSD